MQLFAFVSHLAELVGGDAQLGIDLVNDRAGAARALVVHRWQLLLFTGFGVFFEDDDLGVLPAQLDDRAALGIKLFDRERYRIDFLDELRAHVLAARRAARAGDEAAEILFGPTREL